MILYKKSISSLADLEAFLNEKQDEVAPYINLGFLSTDPSRGYLNITFSDENYEAFRKGNEYLIAPSISFRGMTLSIMSLRSLSLSRKQYIAISESVLPQTRADLEEKLFRLELEEALNAD